MLGRQLLVGYTLGVQIVQALQHWQEGVPDLLHGISTRVVVSPSGLDQRP